MANEKIKVDFLRFNLQFIEKSKIQEVAEYLSREYSCNSVFIDKKKTYPLIKKSRFSCKAKFLTSHTKYWIGTRLEFEGTHASTFYDSIKNRALDWDHMNFEDTNLGRFDLCYTRSFKKTDSIEDYENFLKSTTEIISIKNASTQVELKPKVNPKTLEIGNRKTSGNFFRVYKRPNGKSIRFELEMKFNIAKNFQFFLFTGQFEIEKSCYTDWVLENFRKLRILRMPENVLVSTYLTNKLWNTVEEKELLYKLFQLLSYIRHLEYSFSWIVDQEYRVVSFKLRDFLEFIDSKNNHYQVIKFGKFLNFLQSLPPMLSVISEDCFKSTNIFPYIKVFKKKSWNVQLAIAEELYDYRYPFYFPKYFLNSKNKYASQAKISFWIAFSVKRVNKILNVEEFFAQFKVSNSNLGEVKKALIETFLLAKDSKMIEDEFVVILKTEKKKMVRKLTTNLISRTKLIFFNELPEY